MRSFPITDSEPSIRDAAMLEFLDDFEAADSDRFTE